MHYKFIWKHSISSLIISLLFIIFCLKLITHPCYVLRLWILWVIVLAIFYYRHLSTNKSLMQHFQDFMSVAEPVRNWRIKFLFYVVVFLSKKEITGWENACCFNKYPVYTCIVWCIVYWWWCPRRWQKEELNICDTESVRLY